MNEQATRDLLDQHLTSLAEDVPPMPEDFHASWMKRVEDEAMQKPSRKTTWTRILSVAAAAVFVIGGTLLTRDELGAPSQSQTNRTYYEESAAAGGYSLSASYDAADNGAVMFKAQSTSDTMAYGEAAQEKKIIRTASLNISTQTFDKSLAELKQKCLDAGGWIAFSSENGDGDRRTANLTMRLPSPQLDSFLQGAGDAGRITWRSESADDVTESYYDTKARLETQQALMDRLQALITDAADLGDLLALESQIADTQYLIDSLQASLNSTDRQVDYATVEVYLREESPSDAITDTEVGLGQRILRALETGLESFTAFLSDMVVFLAASLPFMAVVAVVVIIVKLIRRKKK